MMSAGASDTARLMPLLKPFGIILVAIILLVVILHHGLEPLRRFLDRMRAANQTKVVDEDSEPFFPTDDPNKRLAAVLGEATGQQVEVGEHTKGATDPARLHLDSAGEVLATEVRYLNGKTRNAGERRPSAEELLDGLPHEGAELEEVLV